MNYFDFYEKAYGSFNLDFSQIKSFLTRYNPDKIAELGAGLGRTLPLYKGRKVIAIEPNRNVHQILNEKSLASELSSFEINSSFSYKLSIESNSQDAVLIPFGGLAEMYPIYFTLSEAARILRPGGHLYFLIQNEKCYKGMAEGVKISKQLGCEFDFSIEAIHLQNFGPSEFQTIINVRKDDDQHNFVVEQAFPPISTLIRILERLDLQLIEALEGFGNEAFNESSSSLFCGIFEKHSNQNTEPVYENAKAAKAIYDGFASKYSEVVEKGEYSVPAFLEKYAGEYIGHRCSLLDLGCANGYIGNYLANLGIKLDRVFGLDVSPEMIKSCKKGSIYTNAEVWDLSEGLPLFKARQFDLVTCFGVLEFIENKELLISEIIKCLRIGGEAFLSFEVSPSESEVSLAVGNFNFKRFPLHFESVKKLLDRPQIKVITCEETAGYKSPTTGQYVPYALCKIRRISS